MRFKGKMKSFFSLLLILSIIFVFCGCGSSEKVNKSEASKGTKIYTDMLGRKVELKTDIKRIVLLRTMDIYMLSSILGEDLDDKLIAVGTDFKTGDIDGYKKFSETFDLSHLTNVGSVYEDDGINPETIVSLKPDIIIVDKQFEKKASVQKMIKLGLPVVFTDINSDPFHGIENSIFVLGEMLGYKEKIDKMVKYANEKTDSILKRIDSLLASGVAKPVLYFECGNVPPNEIGMTDGDVTNSWGYYWDKLGADNIGIGHNFQSMNPEEVLKANPDLIVIGGSNWDPKADIMRLGYYASKESASEHLQEYVNVRAGWTELKAIKNQNLHSIHYNYHVYPYNFCGVEASAKFLFPEEFKDLNPEKDRKEFFDEFMPIKYSGTLSADWK